MPLYPPATTTGYTPGGTDVAVADGGTGASTAAAAATNLGLGTGDSPQFTAVNIGAATDTTLARVSAGNLSVEGNALYRAGGTDVAVADGGTGSSTASAARTALGLVIGTDVRAQGSGDPTSLGGADVTPPLSLAIPPWVKPTGSGAITNDAQGRITIDSGASYKMTPGMTFLEGRLHLVYGSGTGHNAVGNVIKYRYSDDLGRTWSTAVTIASPSGGRLMSDPSIVALSSGRLLVGFDDDDGSGVPLFVSVIYSDNRGQSWSGVYAVPVTGMSGECAGTSQPIELVDGSILLPAFGNAGGNNFCVVFKSTDGGLTFPTQVTVASSGSRHYQELQIRLLASGNIVGLMRSDTNAHIWRTVSTDGGATWSTPADVLTASSRPDFVEFFPGALIFFGRSDNTNFYPRWAVSWDEGATWTSLQEIDSGSTLKFVYGAPVVLAPGYVAVAYGLENSGSDADLYLRYYHDGYGTDTLGNITALTVSPGATFATPAVVLGTAAAAGAASTAIRSDSTIVAFDATAPTTQAFSDSAATGSAAVAARRDHKHGMPAATGTGSVTTVKDEGSNLSTAVVSLDFVGAGVTATGTTAVTVTIPGGSGITRTTLGTTSVGASFDGTRQGYLKKVTLATDGLLASIVASLKGDNGGGQISAFLMTDAAGTPALQIYGDVSAQRDSGNRTTPFALNSTARWVTFAIGAWLTAGDYWLGILNNGTGTSPVMAYSSGTGSDRTIGSGTDQVADNSVSASSSGTNDYSIYANILR